MVQHAVLQLYGGYQNTTTECTTLHVFSAILATGRRESEVERLS